MGGFFIGPNSYIFNEVERVFFIFLLLLVTSCGTQIRMAYNTPASTGMQGYLYPTHLEFMKNGRCIKTSGHDGSDSGSISYQHLGDYKQANDTIQVHFFWKHSKLNYHFPNDVSIEDTDWEDMEEYNATYVLINDTLWTINDQSSGKLYYIIDTE